MFHPEQIQIFEIIRRLSVEQGMRVYLVGGVVRDLFLKHEIKDKDFDFIVEGNALTFGQKLKELCGGELKEYPAFLTCSLIAPTKFAVVSELDFATARTEVYLKPGELPKVLAATIDEDLARRDFTINAMAIPLDSIGTSVNLDLLPKITIDKFDGIKDLKSKLIRVLHPLSFLDDPTRIFRACRYAVRIEGAIFEESEKLLLEAVERGALETISLQRKLNEIKIIIGEPRPQAILTKLKEYGVLNRFHLYDESNEAQVMQALTALARTTCPHLLKFNVALRLFYKYLGENGNDFIIKAGLGRKFLAQAAKDVLLDRSDVASATSEALLLRYIHGDSDQGLLNELGRRGILLNDKYCS